MSILYSDAGVNIDAGDEAVERIKQHVKKTYSPAVLSGVGGFGSAYDLQSIMERYTHPVLVQSVDGVGTKLMVAQMLGAYKSIGHDIVGNCCGDIVVMGARPLTFLDYIAASKLEPAIIEEIVSGMADACALSHVSLIGGETAEMPGVYRDGEHDVVGHVTGVVEKEKMITGARITPGDVVLGLASRGLHTNGFSLARKLFFEVGKYTVHSYIEELDTTVGTALLKPHTNYTNPILSLLDANVEIKGMAHITGGGMTENIPRVLPEGCAVEIHKGAWPVLPIFDVMQRIGDVPESEMYRTFNMGIGMALIVARDMIERVRQKLATQYPEFMMYEIGSVVHGNKSVR